MTQKTKKETKKKQKRKGKKRKEKKRSRAASDHCFVRSFDVTNTDPRNSSYPSSSTFHYSSRDQCKVSQNRREKKPIESSGCNRGKEIKDEREANQPKQNRNHKGNYPDAKTNNVTNKQKSSMKMRR